MVYIHLILSFLILFPHYPDSPQKFRAGKISNKA